MFWAKWVGVCGGMAVVSSMLLGCGHTNDDHPKVDAGAGTADEPDSGDAGGTSDSGGSGGTSGAAGASGENDACAGRLIECESHCVDPKFDPQNCGSCDTVCPAGELCSAAQCSASCLGGTTQCGARCVDVDSD